MRHIRPILVWCKHARHMVHREVQTSTRHQFNVARHNHCTSYSSLRGAHDNSYFLSYAIMPKQGSNFLLCSPSLPPARQPEESSRHGTSWAVPFPYDTLFQPHSYPSPLPFFPFGGEQLPRHSVKESSWAAAIPFAFQSFPATMVRKKEINIRHV